MSLDLFSNIFLNVIVLTLNLSIYIYIHEINFFVNCAQKTGEMKFTCLFSVVKAFLKSTKNRMAPDLSVHIAYVCLLYLANEKVCRCYVIMLNPNATYGNPV